MTSTVLPYDTDPYYVSGISFSVRFFNGDIRDFIPDIEYEAPVIVIAEISDGCGNRKPVCWETDGRRLSDCLEPVDSYDCFFVDEKGDLRGVGNDIQYGTSSYLFRVFRSDIGRDERLWLADLINSAYELDGSIMEEVERCTYPIGKDLFTEGIC